MNLHTKRQVNFEGLFQWSLEWKQAEAGEVGFDSIALNLHFVSSTYILVKARHPVLICISNYFLEILMLKGIINYCSKRKPVFPIEWTTHWGSLNLFYSSNIFLSIFALVESKALMVHDQDLNFSLGHSNHCHTFIIGPPHVHVVVLNF